MSSHSRERSPQYQLDDKKKLGELSAQNLPNVPFGLSGTSYAPPHGNNDIREGSDTQIVYKRLFLHTYLYRVYDQN